MRQAYFPTPWLVIRSGRIVAEFDSEVSARLYVEIQGFTDTIVLRKTQP